MGNSVYSKLPSHPDYNPGWAPVDKYDDYQLHETAGQGYGVIGYYGGNSMELIAAYEFIEAQFVRFKIMPPQRDFIEWCWEQAFYYIDQFDPYALLGGCCDVIKTEECYYYQYAISSDGEEWVEVPNTELETFRLWEEDGKNKGEEAWEILMEHPGLPEYFDHIYDYFQDHFHYIMEDDHPECYEREWEFIQKYGRHQIQDLAHLGIWAAIMWMCSPYKEAKDWRYEFHPIFRICYDYGACVLHEWTFHDPRYFQRIDRKSQSCANCGVDTYCVDLTQTSYSNSEYLCEHCLSDGLPFPGRTCGTKLCEHTTCPNHPVSNMTGEEQRVAKRAVMQIAADRRFGSLHQLPDGRQVRSLPGYMKINEIAIAQEAKTIADTVSNVFAGLLENL